MNLDSSCASFDYLDHCIFPPNPLSFGPSPQMQALLGSVLSTIASPSPDDPIRECFNNNDAKLRALLCEKPDKALNLADKELRVFPFKDVRDCWRRLYTDASIVKACHIIQEHC